MYMAAFIYNTVIYTTYEIIKYSDLYKSYCK